MNKDIIIRKTGVSNFSSNEKLNQSKIINGDPTGIADWNNPTRKWAVSVYDIMLNYNWHHSECSVGSDIENYNKLSAENKLAYDLSLAQIIANDNLQDSQLVDSIAGYITDPLVKDCLIRQASEEVHHHRSYGVMASDVCADSNRIYNMHNEDKMLARKNNSVEAMYKKVNSLDNDISVHDYQKAVAANNVLEQQVFPGGFLVLWHIAEQGLPGTAKMIGFIERDESGTHVPLFKNIFSDIRKEYGLDPETEKEISEMIILMCEEDKVWIKYLTSNLLGFSEHAIDMFSEHMANIVYKNLKITSPYKETDGGPLMSVFELNSMLSNVKNKTNQFEQAVGDYTTGGLDEDY